MEISTFIYFINEHQRIYWLYLLSSLLLAFVVSRGSRIKLFDKRVYLHQSALLDYRLFIINIIVKVAIIAPLFLAVNDLILYTLKGMHSFFGLHEIVEISRASVMFLYTLTLFVVNDLSRFLLHRWMHTNKFLWRFHSIHHSAEVLTPITYYRVHPLETLLYAFRYLLVTGTLTGIFIYYFGVSLAVIDILGVNIFIFLYNILGANLRHSHIPLSFGYLEYLFVSPSMHQIHHTQDGYNSNYGTALSLWDQLFQSFHRQKRETPFGLVTSQHVASLRSLLLAPFYIKTKDNS